VLLLSGYLRASMSTATAMGVDQSAAPARLVDGFGREITYVRLSITDRCDLRCVYCMAEQMTFLPRNELLTIEELARLGKTFTELGVHKLRITGGEPLVRRGVIRSEEHTSELQSRENLVCRLLLE